MVEREKLKRYVCMAGAYLSPITGCWLNACRWSTLDSKINAEHLSTHAEAWALILEE